MKTIDLKADSETNCNMSSHALCSRLCAFDKLAEWRHLYQIGYLCENVLARIHFLQIIKLVRNERFSNRFCQKPYKLQNVNVLQENSKG